MKSKAKSRGFGIGLGAWTVILVGAAGAVGLQGCASNRAHTEPAATAKAALASSPAPAPALASTPALGASVPARMPGDNLTEELARRRREAVAKVAYRLEITFAKGRGDFGGNERIEAELARIDQPLSIDALYKELRRVVVNGREIHDYGAQAGSIEIPAKYLNPHLVVELDYVGFFNPHAHGVQRFVDPADGREYIHTDFEPYHAHELFPCFDQPDLKARYEVSIVAPRDWEVIGNSPSIESTVTGQSKRTRFSATEPMSPYLVFVGAGAFYRWDSQMLGGGPEGRALPLHLYARASVAKFVDAERLFEITRKGLGFFNGYFDFRYPFPKYDHVFVADYGHGAMENPGAVTMNERMLFRGPVSADRRVGRDATILHEMAHMWFGDLVTTAWWNDTWLNESFATYMSHLALAGLGQPTESWLGFNEEKAWAYLEDGLVTTHPIEAKVDDAQNAMANFDGITYGKGASALKQLSFFVGAEKFREGVRRYIHAHAWGNARRSDFVAAVASAAGTDLEGWTHAWLQTAGIQRVTTDWSCANGHVSRMAVVQEPSSSGTLSSHKTEIALIRRDPGGSGTLQMIDRFAFEYDGKRSDVLDAVGRDCPDLVYANLADQDYAVFSLDPVSLRTASASLGGVPDPLLRQMIWESLIGMVRDGQLPVREYMAMAARALPREREPAVLGRLLGRHSALRDAYWDYLTPTERDSLAPVWERMAWEQVVSTEDRDAHLIWFDFYVSIAHSPGAASRLAELLKSGRIPGKFKLALDQPRRWNILGQVARSGRAGILPVIDREARRDHTNEGSREAFAARAALPDLGRKRKLWAELLRDDALSWPLRGQALRSFNDPDRPELGQPFVDEYFAAAGKLDWSAQPHLVRGFFHDLFPALCTPDLLAKSREAFASFDARLSDIARRAWRERNDELERCIKVRAVGDVHRLSDEAEHG